MKTYVLLLPFLYIYLYLIAGFFLFLGNLPEDGNDWMIIIGSSIIYLTAGFLGFFAITGFSLYQLIRNSVFVLALKKHWPLLIAFIYPFLPNLPGPVDELIVATIMGGLAAYMGLKKKPDADSNTQTLQERQ